MKRVVVMLVVLSLASSAWAGPIADSAARAVNAQRRGYIPSPSGFGSTRQWLGITLVATGITFMAAGFSQQGLPTTQGSGGATQARNPTLGLVGVGLVGGGVALLFAGRKTHSPQIAFGPRHVAVSQTVTF